MAIHIDRDVIVKTGAPDRIEVEALKLLSAQTIADKSGLFIVPEILDWDARAGRIVMRRLVGLQGVRRKAVRGTNWRGLAVGIGRSLAAIHRDLVLPERFKIRLPEGLDDAHDNAFLHGDFSGENVCVTGDGKLAIIDWQMSPRYGGLATYGPRYFDLCWLLCNLFRRPPHVYLMAPFPWDFAARVINAYALATGENFDRDGFIGYHTRFYEFRLTNQTGAERALIKQVLLAPGYRIWNRFMLGGRW